jgi:hypothetical protein
MERAADAVKAAAAIAQAVADGELTPSEANELSGLVANYAKPEAVQRKQGGFFVIRRDTEKDRRRQVDELIASGKAGPDSLFIHIRNLLDGETDEGAKLRKGSKP